MYTGSLKVDDYKKIDAFLIAYEIGSMGVCKFREKLIRQIKEKYDVQCPSEGLAKQLRRASRKAKQEISDFFVNESLKILVAESDNNNQNKFISYKRKQLVVQLEQLSKEISIRWVSNFSREIRDLKAWTGVNLTNDEITRAEKIVDVINQLIKDDVMKLVVVPEHIEILKIELIKKLNAHMR